MKINHKGMTLSEVLCYIVIFSLLISIITGYLIYLFKFNNHHEINQFQEIMYLENTCNNIKDQKFINEEELKLIKDEESIKILGQKTKLVYLEYNYQTKKMDNGIIGKSLIFQSYELQFILNEDFLIITNDLNNFYFVVEVKNETN